jgi:RNase P/RNase MRP subunit POP5
LKYVRRRYLALKVECEGSADYKAVSEAIWNSVLRLFGEVGCSQAGLYLVGFDTETNRAVVRCSHKALPMVRASIASITKIGNQRAAFHILRVSGTLKALNKRVASFDENKDSEA